ncbi:hypothetical protein [Acinetobacter proteolyticus]|nr:hypothetical protein [Acinetobacter proteolyticus]
MNIKAKCTFLLSSMILLGAAQAQIPTELIHQNPNISDDQKITTIQGFQKTSTALRFIKARIYISYINNKATLSKSNEWNKPFQIEPTATEIRIISDTPNLLAHGHIIFNAKSGQHYQVKSNQADIKMNKEPILFWVENMDTGEIVTSKEILNGSPSSTNINLIPVITNK